MKSAKMKVIVILIMISSISCYAHNSYTGGYSGSPGMRTCALSCHGGSSGTLTVKGFPANYTPGQTYRIVISHNGGAQIVNFNLTAKLGSSTTVAGTFSNVLNAANYTGIDGGVYANPHLIDSAVINWTAPAAGSGTINLYAAAFQNTSINSNGQSSAIKLTSSETVTGINNENKIPTGFVLQQNFPNPFNPVTKIKYSIPLESRVNVVVYNLLGKKITELINTIQSAGNHEVAFNANNLESGVYFYRITAVSTNGKKEFNDMKKLLLLK